MEELLDTLSAAELADWAEFYALEPWGSEAAFVRSGIISAVIANVNRNSKSKPEPFTPTDFMPDFGGKRRKAKMDPKRIRGLLSATFGERIKKRGSIRKVHGDGTPDSPKQHEKDIQERDDAGNRPRTDKGGGTSD